MNIQKYNKGIAPVVVGVIMLLLNQLGIQEGDTVKEAVTSLVTAAAVYFVPNKQ